MKYVTVNLSTLLCKRHTTFHSALLLRLSLHTAMTHCRPLFRDCRFLVGNKLTYVDLALLHVLRASASQFPEEWKKLETIPLLKAYEDRLSARPNLAAYFKSDRCRPFEGNSMM